MSQNSKTQITRPLLIPVVILVGLICWLGSPNLNPAYANGLAFWTVTLVLLVVGTIPVTVEGTPRDREVTLKARVRMWLAICIMGISALQAFVTSSPILHADSYYQLLGEEKTADFSVALPPIDLNQAPLVSSDMAARAAEKKLAEVPALGSQVELGRMTKQLVRGQLYWVAFLHHRDFFKWWSEGSTPGYVMVSATDASDVALVTEVKGQALQMKYLTSAYFLQDLERYLWLNGFATTGMTDISPEIDEEGRPFYVVTTYSPKVGYGGQDATGVLAVDVQTGEVKRYSVDQAPAWIDRIQPEHLVEAQVESRLTYMHGWWNPSDKDRQAISGDVDLVYGTNGKAYYFVGITSVAKEGGLTGFMLVDTHTKEVTRFNFSGVTESVAQRAAEGVMPEKRYMATNALPFIVHGEPTYVMALRDDTGLARAYAVVNMRDFNVVATGESLQSAIRLYQQKLSMDRSQSESQAAVETITAEFVVQRIGSEVRSGGTVYFLTVQGKADLMLMGNSELSEKLVLTQVGDKISVKFKKGAGLVAPMISFDNHAIGG